MQIADCNCRLKNIAGLFAALAVASAAVLAQTPEPRRFDVVSIKRVRDIRQGGRQGTGPDGSLTMENGIIFGLLAPLRGRPRCAVGKLRGRLTG